MPLADDHSIKEILGLDPVAIIGCSRHPGKAAHDVPRYLVEQGFDIIPINPNADEILGRTAVPSISAVDRDVHLVTVFRPSEEVPAIVDDVLERDDVKAIWLQLGITDDRALERAETAGLVTVQNRCMSVEHRRLFDQ